MGRRDGDRRRRRAGGFNSDAQAFFDAVVANGGTLTATEKDAVNAYVLAAKDANRWWEDTLFDYPMVGGTANSCAINLRFPAVFFNITWVNTVAGDFTANGWTPNGATSYGMTGLVPSDDLTIQSVTVEYYSRTQHANATVDIGSSVAANQRILLFIRNATPQTNFQTYDNALGQLLSNQADSRGGFTMTRMGANDARSFKNGVQYGVTLLTTGGTQPNIEIYIGAFNNGGVAALHGTRQSAGMLMGNGFTPAQVLAQYQARQTMNTSLSRQL